MNGGRNDFGTQSGLPSATFTYGISGDGTTMVGGAAYGSNPVRAYRYRGSGTFESLGTIGTWAMSDAWGASGDGSIVVGGVRDVSDFTGQAFRWTQAGGMQGLGWTRAGHFHSQATGISRDGGTIVGYSFDGGTEDGFIWTESAGMRSLRGINGANAQVFAVNDIGTIVVGSSRVGIRTHAVLWQGDSLLDLGVTPELRDTSAHAVSDDGSVVVGLGTMPSGQGNRGWIWTSTTGGMLFSTYLTQAGIQVPIGWTFIECTSVSSDGRTIGGYGAFAGDRYPSGFVVTLPSPAGLLCLGAWFCSKRRRR